MNKTIEIIFTAIILFSLSGCINEEDVNTKDFYMKNESERITKIKYCNERPDKKIVDQNCINALSANSQLKTDLLRGDGIVVDYSAANEKAAVKEKTPYEKMLEEKMLAVKKKAESEAKNK